MRRFLVVLATLIASALAVPAGADAALKAIWGPRTLPNGKNAFDVYAELGVDVYQHTVFWNRIAPRRPANPRNPNDPAYTWPERLDVANALAAERGINLALLVTASPPWANGGRFPNWAPANDDYADFLVALNRRYPLVRYWMIWGEPNGGAFRPNRSDTPAAPRRYATLLDRAYETLKAENPGNTVIGGMTFTSGRVKPADFLRWMRLPNGKPPRLDWYGHNPFSRRFPRVSDPPSVRKPSVRDFNDIDTLASEVRRTYRVLGTRPQLWLSEFTIQSGESSQAFSYYTTEKGQAQWLQRAYEIVDRQTKIAGMGWLSLVDAEREGGGLWGLLRSNGARKPSFFAYRRAPSRRYTGAVSVPATATVAQLQAGIDIGVKPVLGGTVTVSLLRGERTLARAVARGADRTQMTVRLAHGPVEPGSYLVTVKTKRGETLERRLQVLP